MELVVRRLWAGFTAPRTFDAPRIANDGAALRAGLVNPSITWIGHSTLLIQMNGLNVLTDPNWGMRASPLSWAGPRRLSPPGLAFEHLPEIDVVVISHDHYDHRTLGTVRPCRDTQSALPGAAGPQGVVRRQQYQPGRGTGLVAGARIPWCAVRLCAGPALLPANAFGRQHKTLGVVGRVES